MSVDNIPQTDSIDELARFWDTHDVTDFEDELEEVAEPVFVKEATIQVPLGAHEVKQLEQLAESKGLDAAHLIREWVLERLSNRA